MKKMYKSVRSIIDISDCSVCYNSENLLHWKELLALSTDNISRHFGVSIWVKEIQ